MLYGIDVSKWQGSIDWSKVKTDFAILKAGYGREYGQIDPYFAYNYRSARAYGVPIGAYWYSYANSVEDAHREASACINALGGKKFEFPIYYDMEEANQAALGKAECTAIAVAFCRDLEKAGFFVGIYANTSWWQTYLDHDLLSKYFTVWLADYRVLYNRTLTRQMHQYSSKGSVAGISGRVDLNTSNVDFAPIIKRAGLNGFAGSVTATESKNEKLKTLKVTASSGDAKAVTAFCEERQIPCEVVE